MSSSTNTANDQQAPYRAPCTKCTELQVQLAKATAKKPRAKYELYFAKNCDGDRVGLFISRLVGLCGLVAAVIMLATGVGWRALLAWPIVPAIVAAHCVSIRKIDPKE